MKLLSVFLAVGLFLVVGAAQAVTVSESTGKGAFSDVDKASGLPVIVSVSFKAGIDANGKVYGSLQVAQNGKGKIADLSYHGDVNCYVLIDPTTAVFSGVITKSTSTDPNFAVGSYFLVVTVESLTTDPDQIFIITSTTPFDCTSFKLNLKDLNPLIRGSITIHE